MLDAYPMPRGRWHPASITVRSWAGLTTLQALTLPDLPREHSMAWRD